jgi:hypothetical protein
MTGFQSKRAMSQNLVEFTFEIAQLPTEKVIALADLYAEQQSPSTYDTVRRAILEAELDRRESML